MATVTAGVHLRERDIAHVGAHRTKNTIVLSITPEVTVFLGHGTDETALLLAAIVNACTEAQRLNADRARDMEPQPGAGAEYGMEAERG